jgi:hypothetical protein
MQNKRRLLLIFAFLLVLFLAVEGVSATRHYTEDDLDADIGDLDDSLDDLEEHEATEDDNAEERFDEDPEHLESFDYEEHALAEEDIYENDLASEMLDDDEVELEADTTGADFEDDESMEDTVAEQSNVLNADTVVLAKEPAVVQEVPPRVLSEDIQKAEPQRVAAEQSDAQNAKPQEIAPVKSAKFDGQVQEAKPVPNVEVKEVVPVKSADAEVAQVQEAKINAVASNVQPLPNNAQVVDPLAVDKSPNSIVMGLAGSFAALLLIAIVVASLLVMKHKQESLKSIKEDQMLYMKNGKRFTKPLLEREEQESPYIVMRRHHEQV